MAFAGKQELGVEDGLVVEPLGSWPFCGRERQPVAFKAGREKEKGSRKIAMLD